MSRALGYVLVFIAFAVPDVCVCLPDAVPPEIPQFIDEVGARPLQVVVGEVRLAHVNEATVKEQKQIIAALTGFCFEDGHADDVKEQLSAAFQEHGFFKALVQHLDIVPLDKNAVPPTVAVTAYMDEGHRYRLKEINFRNNKAITSTARLRALFPIEDGDILRTPAIRKGLERLRQAYGELGYLNFVSVPDTHIDDAHRLITLDIDVDEGGQFVVRSFDVVGADPVLKAALFAKWKLPPGTVYSSRAVERFFAEAKELLAPGVIPEQTLIIKQGNKQQAVDIVLDLEHR